MPLLATTSTASSASPPARRSETARRYFEGGTRITTCAPAAAARASLVACTPGGISTPGRYGEFRRCASISSAPSDSSAHRTTA